MIVVFTCMVFTSFVYMFMYSFDSVFLSEQCVGSVRRLVRDARWQRGMEIPAIVLLYLFLAC